MYAYGPVPSRRLGQSLGVSPVPPKTCSYNCIYCQLGRTNTLQARRDNFFPKEDILTDIETIINSAPADYITFVGDGEPTLYKDIGWLISQCKKKWYLPVTVITNGSLFYLKDVRQDMKACDVVLPTLDAGSEEVYRKINRPHSSIGFDKMLKGQIEFRQEYSGKIWLEVMLVEGVNDSDTSLIDIKHAIEQIQPDRVYLSVPIRPPSETWVRPPAPERIIRAHEILGTVRDLAHYESGEFGLNTFTDGGTAILELCSRHPLREEQAKAIEARFSEIGSINSMLLDGILVRIEYQKKYYLLPARFVRRAE